MEFARRALGLGVCSVALIVLGLSACAHRSSTDPPLEVATTPLATPPTAAARVMLYEIAFDPTDLSYSVTPIPPRQATAQPPQALTYDLDIEQFLNGDSFDVAGISVDAEGDFVFRFMHSHPFPAPNFGNPTSGLNRADLSYTGRLLILADRESQRFFSNTIALDPGLVKNPDGYVNPGDLLAASGFSNNTFPFVLLADDGQDNRIGITNGGSPTGNYHDNAFGWQRDTIGFENNAWTGYDFIHGGQTIENEFTITAEALGAGQVNFAVAFLIKYTDPRGMGGVAGRLPPLTQDPLAFAYRLPFAALDVSVVRVESAGTIDVLQGESGRIDVAIRDWDAQANPAISNDLSLETNVNLVPPGTEGFPEIAIDAPFLSAAPLTLVNYDGGSGQPGLEVKFFGDLVNDLGTAPEGEQLALIRVTDPEDALDATTGYHFGVDPATILPSTIRALDLRTYQTLPLTLVDVASCPQSSLTFDFNSNGYQDWLLGGLGTGNGDSSGWGGFSIGCRSTAAESALFGLTGKYLTTTNDVVGSPTACDFEDDYGADANYNIVSPIFHVPELCGLQRLELSFTGGMWTRTSGRLEVYTTTNEGANWLLQGTVSATGAQQRFTPEQIPLTVAGNESLRIRLRFVDPADTDFQMTGQSFVGLFLDNVSLTVDSADPLTVESESPCLIWQDDFEGPTDGWLTYGLPQTDAAITEGAACGQPGPWGGTAICPVFAGEVFLNAMTFSGDGGQCDRGIPSLPHSSDYNIVSPPINLTAAGAGTQLQFDELKGSRIDFSTWTTTVYIAVNPAQGDPSEANWGAPVAQLVHVQGEGNGSVKLIGEIPAAALGQANVRVRVQVTTPPNTTGYAECPGNQNICQCVDALAYCGAGFIGFDNIEIGDFSNCG